MEYQKVEMSGIRLDIFLDIYLDISKKRWPESQKDEMITELVVWPLCAVLDKYLDL